MSEFTCWNTSRLYSPKGQRMAATVMSDGRVAFSDIDRRIDGITYGEIPRGPFMHVRDFVMIEYDRSRYDEASGKLEQRLLNALRAAAAAVEYAELDVGGPSRFFEKTHSGFLSAAKFARSPQELFGFAALLGGIYSDTGDEEFDSYSWVEEGGVFGVHVNRATLEIEVVGDGDKRADSPREGKGG